MSAGEEKIGTDTGKGGCRRGVGAKIQVVRKSKVGRRKTGTRRSEPRDPTVVGTIDFRSLKDDILFNFHKDTTPIN